MSAKYALNRSLSRADSSGSFNNNNSNNKKPQNDYSNLNETETTALLYDETIPSNNITTNTTNTHSFNDRNSSAPNTPKQQLHDYALNPENRKKNSIYILDQDASIIMHHHHFDVNKFRNNQEAPIYMPANSINQFDTYSISNKKFIQANLQQQQQRQELQQQQQQKQNYSYYRDDIRIKSPSPSANRIIRFDDANNKIYDFLPNQAIRQNVNYIPVSADLMSANFKVNEYQLTRNRGLNGSYMSNSSNSSGGGGGGGGAIGVDMGGFVNRSNSVGMRASSTSSSSSSSAFLDRKESMRIGLQYLPSSLGYSSIGKDILPKIFSVFTIKKRRAELII